MSKRFIVTDEHMKLLAHANVRFEDLVEYGAPGFDQKRPYGNSDVPRDIHEILGWAPVQAGQWDEPEPDHERARAIHIEMATVLQILCHHPGEDILGEWDGGKYGFKWERVA